MDHKRRWRMAGSLAVLSHVWVALLALFAGCSPPDVGGRPQTQALPRSLSYPDRQMVEVSADICLALSVDEDEFAPRPVTLPKLNLRLGVSPMTTEAAFLDPIGWRVSTTVSPELAVRLNSDQRRQIDTVTSTHGIVFTAVARVGAPNAVKGLSKLLARHLEASGMFRSVVYEKFGPEDVDYIVSGTVRKCYHREQRKEDLGNPIFGSPFTERAESLSFDADFALKAGNGRFVRSYRVVKDSAHTTPRTIFDNAPAKKKAEETLDKSSQQRRTQFVADCFAELAQKIASDRELLEAHAVSIGRGHASRGLPDAPKGDKDVPSPGTSTVPTVPERREERGPAPQPVPGPASAPDPGREHQGPAEAKPPGPTTAKAHFAAPFGVRPGILGNGAECSFAMEAGQASLGAASFRSTKAGQELCFKGNWDKDVGGSTDLYLSGIGEVTLKSGRKFVLPLLDPPTEGFEAAVKKLASKDFLERANGAWVLGELGDRRGIEALRQRLNEPHFYARKYIEQSIRHLETLPKDIAEPKPVPEKQPPEAAPGRDFDDALVRAGRKKAQELGLNPVPAYVGKEGNIIVCAGTLFTIREGRFVLVDNDMIYNVGDRPMRAVGLSLAKGEAAAIRNGQAQKIEGALKAD